MKKFNKLSVKNTILVLIISLVVVGGLSFFLYVRDYYHADYTATSIVDESNDRIVKKDDLIIFLPEEGEYEKGFIFYPGGKVEYTAYAPLLEKLSDDGITVFLVKMPFNLAIFNSGAAGDIISEYTDVLDWYIGGHSLGGAMASSYAIENQDKFTGMVLLGAYPVDKTDLDMVTIYGSEDKVLNRDKLENAQNQIEIPGGNHGFFGNYGDQDGDGEATITREEQQELTVEYIVDFMTK